jgi:hypothetical protein
MRINLQIDDAIGPALRRFLRTDLPEHRRVVVDETLRDVLADVVQLNPVDTARSRAAWVSSLEQLGGQAPAGWQGPSPLGEAEGRAAGDLSRQSDADRSSAAATNAVPYAGFLEYGTSAMRPYGMVRRTLWQARERLLDRLGRMFH